jgi:hypothetical protein
MADNIESRMKFIIEQQAQFAVDMQLLKERQADSQRMIDENRGMIRQLVDVTLSLARHGEETDRRFKETDRQFKETARLIQELREAQAHSDGRLDALIDTVDKLVRRNGS